MEQVRAADGDGSARLGLKDGAVHEDDFVRLVWERDGKIVLEEVERLLGQPVTVEIAIQSESHTRSRPQAKNEHAADLVQKGDAVLQLTHAARKAEVRHVWYLQIREDLLRNPLSTAFLNT